MPERCAKRVEVNAAMPRRRRFVPPIAVLLLGGCAVAPPPASEPGPGSAAPSMAIAAAEVDAGARVLVAASARLGAPYRFGAAGPDAFDCSGLVHFAHLGIGLSVPRTAAAQRLAATPVPGDALRAGDLVFFRMGGTLVDHVGIYDGAGHFIHAPGSGRGVERARLDTPWYFGRLAGAGRFWPAAVVAP
jgi:cell wall-associated NlpC family hydrolase